MKALCFILAAAFPFSSFGQSQNSNLETFFKSATYMITESTQIRIQAVAQNDFAKACKVTQSSASVDTMAYYISFEIFDEPALKTRFYKQIGPFAARNYESMYRQNLPQALHQACVGGNRAEIRKVLEQIKSIYILE